MLRLNEVKENLRCRLGIEHVNGVMYDPFSWDIKDEADLWNAVAQHYIGEDFPVDPTGSSMLRLLRALKSDGWVIGSLIRR